MSQPFIACIWLRVRLCLVLVGLEARLSKSMSPEVPAQVEPMFALEFEAFGSELTMDGWFDWNHENYVKQISYLSFQMIFQWD